MGAQWWMLHPAAPGGPALSPGWHGRKTKRRAGKEPYTAPGAVLRSAPAHDKKREEAPLVKGGKIPYNERAARHKAAV